MIAPIFPNCSYFMAFSSATNSDFIGQMEAASERHECRIFHCSEPGDLAAAVEAVGHPLGLFGCSEGLSELQWNEALEVYRARAKSPTLLLASGAAGESSAAEWSAAIDSFIHDMVPKNLDSIVLHSINSIFPRIFEKIGTFARCASPRAKCDYQLNYTLSAGDVIGHCAVKVNWSALVAMKTDSEEDLIDDRLKEAINQSLGVLAQCLSNTGLAFHLSLPTAYDLSKVPFVQTSKYFPSVHCSNPEAHVIFSVGFIDLSDKPLPDLTSLDPAARSDEVEFL